MRAPARSIRWRRLGVAAAALAGVLLAAGALVLGRDRSARPALCADGRTLVAAGDDAFPPFLWLDQGRPQGFVADYVAELSRATGCPIRLELTRWAQAMARVADGEADLLVGVTDIDERHATYAFTERMLTLQARLFSRREDFDVTDPRALPAGTVVGVQGGDVAATRLRALHPALTLREFPDQAGGLRALAAGELAAFAGDYHAGRWTLRREGLADRVKVVGAPFMLGAYGFAVRRDRTALQAALNDAVAAVKASGAAARLEEQWFGEGYFQRGLSAQVVATVVGALGLALLIVGAWAVTLRMAVVRATRSLHASEQRLRQAQKMEALGQLAGGVAHDFNNLLTVILGASEALGETGRAEQADDLAAIQDAARRASALTRQLLAFSRRSALQPQVLELNGVVEDTARMLRRLLGEHIVLTLRCAPDAGKVTADPDQLAQVLINVALNARDAMPAGGHLLVETRRMRLEGGRAWDQAPTPAGEYVELAVTDDGVGMSPATLQHLFEPFYTTKAVGKGTGLGLSVVYGIVAQSGGHVDVRSAPGQGTTFRIRLPAAPEGAVATAPAPDPPAVPRGSETVLVVEDAEEVGRLVQRDLEGLGYRVRLTCSPAEALRLVAEDPSIGLLITDVVMPGMNGAELAARIAERRPGLPRLFISGYPAGLLPPGAELLQKPFSAAQLGQRVRAALDRA